MIVTQPWHPSKLPPSSDSAGHNAYLAGFFDGLERLMLATSTGVTKSGVTGAAPCGDTREVRRTAAHERYPAKKTKGCNVNRPISRSHGRPPKRMSPFHERQASQAMPHEPHACSTVGVRPFNVSRTSHGNTPAFGQTTSSTTAWSIAAPNEVLALTRSGALTGTGNS